MSATERLMVEESELGGGLPRRVEQAVTEVARTLGFDISRGQPDPRAELPQAIWVDRGRNDVLIRLSEDETIPAAYLDVIMPSLDECLAASDIVERHVKTYDLDALQRLARERMHDEPKWLIRLGLAWIAEQQSEDLLGIIRDALASGNLETRWGAAFVCNFLRWSSLLPVLRTAQETERDPDLKGMLGKVIERIGGTDPVAPGKPIS